MITITVKKRKGNYLEFESKGHAGYAEEGHDIVCAAVSVLVINTVNSFEAFTEDQFERRNATVMFLSGLQLRLQRRGNFSWIPLFSD